MTIGIAKLELVPVALAARMLYQRAYGMPPPEPHLADRLNGLAYCSIAAASARAEGSFISSTARRAA